MKLKKIFSQFKSQRGLTGTDVVLSITIIVATITVISMIYVNMDIANKSVDRASGATRIATNILENIQKVKFDEVTEKLNQAVSSGNATKGENDTYTISGKKIFETTVPATYTVKMKLSTLEGDEYHLIKQIDLTVEYKLNGKTESMTVTTAIEKEIVQDNNAPILLDEYLKTVAQVDGAMALNNEDYTIYPIKYSSQEDSYITTTSEDDTWYNYHSGEWARILAFKKGEDDEAKSMLIDETSGKIQKTVTNTKNSSKTYYMEDYLYVWIPNFGFSKDNNQYYFREGAGTQEEDNNAIALTTVESETGNVLYMNTIHEDIVFDDTVNFDNKVGVWRKYAENQENDTIYHEFTKTPYGTLLMH